MVKADGAVFVAGSVLPDKTILMADVASAVCSSGLRASGGEHPPIAPAVGAVAAGAAIDIDLAPCVDASPLNSAFAAAPATRRAVLPCRRRRPVAATARPIFPAGAIGAR